MEGEIRPPKKKEENCLEQKIKERKKNKKKIGGREGENRHRCSADEKEKRKSSMKRKIRKEIKTKTKWEARGRIQTSEKKKENRGAKK